MNDDFSKYEALRAAGDSAEAIARVAKQDGLDVPAVIRMLRSLFTLSLPEAKEIMLRASADADSLEQHEERIADALDEQS
jgi:hypothetical protein